MGFAFDVALFSAVWVIAGWLACGGYDVLVKRVIVWLIVLGCLVCLFDWRWCTR